MGALGHLDPRDFIIIRGAHMHNLQHTDVAIPRNQLVVVTGLSGSGKSSLIVDTLFVEAQRRYIESVNVYARQFLGKLAKPAVDAVEGLSPAMAIQQGTVPKNPRVTVATVTELAYHLYLLYARIGITYSPISGQKVKKDSVSDVVDYIHQQEEGHKIVLLYPIESTSKEALLGQLRVAQSKGFTKVMQADQLFFIDAMLSEETPLLPDQPLYGVVDRIIVRKDHPSNQHRIADSVQIAFTEGGGTMVVAVVGVETQTFSDRLERDGMLFESPTMPFFNCNTPYGACKACAGLGQVMAIAEEKILPNPELSLAEGVVAPWKGPIMGKWLAPLLKHPTHYALPIHTPYSAFTPDQKKLLWSGKGDFIGIKPFFELCAKQTDKIQYRVLLSRYRSKKTCQACQGSRIRADAHYVRIGQHSLVELLEMPIHQLLVFFTERSFTAGEAAVAQRIVEAIMYRLCYLVEEGLGYLTLNRPVATLSGGEYQRIRLATALGSSLCGIIYILDEPTAGLHPQDIHKLVQRLVDLKNQGNTVIVLEHEEAVMRAADTLIELGPEAGIGGGRLVFQGDLETLLASTDTHTARYLNGSTRIAVPPHRRRWQHSLWIQQASLHNLKAITVAIPLQVLTVVTGVSGSGKSSLITEVFYPALVNYLTGSGKLKSTNFPLVGDFHCIQAVELMSQQPLGKWARSNPLTYLGLFDYIRALFIQTPLASLRNYQRGHFSFNSAKGQCSRCQGEGVEKIDMQFMATIELPCEACRGSRFKPEVLDVHYRDKNIAQVLQMTVDEALSFFEGHISLSQKLKTLQAIGLGYIVLGQPLGSLSRGERQRLKLAYYLAKELAGQSIVCIFDEPTIGLHLRDVHLLITALHMLVEQGHTVIVMEHHMDVIKNADWIIDLGPGGGAEGGHVIFTGRPEQLLQIADHPTAPYLREKM